MSTLNVDKVDPNTGTTLELGTSGDTISVPSGATLDISASTLTPPATMPASSGVNLTALNATQLTSGTLPDARFTTLPAVSGVNLTSLNATNLGSGTVPTARLGSGTASSSTVLYGDQTYKTEPSGFDVTSISGQSALADQPATGDEFVLNDGGTLKKIDFSYMNQHKNFGMMRISEPSTPLSMNTTTLCPFDWDYLVNPYSVCDISAGEHKYTCPETGKYFFFFSVRITNASYNDEMSAAIYVNGGAASAAAYSGGHNLSGNLANAIVLGNSFIYNATANDYFQMYCYTYGSGDSNMASNTCLFGGWQLD